MSKEILIVDDSFDDLELMKKLLEKDGYVVKTATNGAMALDVLTTEKPSIILLDIKMPTVSGYDLTRIFRDKLKKAIKIIYVSIVPKKEVDMSGVDGYIQKPFDKKTFVKTIKKIIHTK